MSLSDYCRAVESNEFAARINAANDLRGFYRALRREPVIARLSEALQVEQRRTEIWRRVLRLAHTAIDRRFRNPFDAALAVYLWLLAQHASALVDIAAEAVLGAPNCWWARKVSDQLLTIPEINQAATFRDQRMVAYGPDISGTQGIDVGETLILTSLISEAARGSSYRIEPKTVIDSTNHGAPVVDSRLGMRVKPVDTRNNAADVAA